MSSIHEARSRRAQKSQELLRLQGGEISLSEVLTHPPEPLGNTDLWDVLLRTPHLGKKGSRRLCEDARVWPHTILNELSPLEVETLLRCLPDRVRDGSLS